MLTEEQFSKLYQETNGFNEQNKNHPVHRADESVIDFINSGCDFLLKNYPELVTGLI